MPISILLHWPRPLVHHLPAELPRSGGHKAERGIRVSHRTILRWVIHFRPDIAVLPPHRRFSGSL